jgi:hypothetical protein
MIEGSLATSLGEIVGSSTALMALYNTEGATLLEYANEERVATPAAGH